ncbi:MAG: hypothetical protein MK207_09195 [Saprospiraceae bacterium]|nr:hypothetical protein [Saprospiraceae bacterium]
MPSVPIINISALINKHTNPNAIAKEINIACQKNGFFYIINHGVDENLQKDLEKYSQHFFALDKDTKMKIRMELGGKAWRGFFPVGDELTSGQPDLKEGIYFGTELNENNPKVVRGLPMHGKNLFLKEVPEFKKCVLDYMNALTKLGHHLMRGLSLSLNLDENYFNKHFTNDPLTLFRIFHYPAAKNQTQTKQWGVGEHTDYGVLTILKQDKIGGLQIKSQNEWIEAPFIEGSFICNIGDMLDKMTGGFYRSTPHRVLNKSGKSRLSFPFFFDPNFDAKIHPIDINKGSHSPNESEYRWDGKNVYQFDGTYGDYVLSKVSKVFPQLKQNL